MNLQHWKQRAEVAERELEGLRILAAEPHSISKVKELLGPLSLWSKEAFEMEVEKRVHERLAYVPQRLAALEAQVEAARAIIDRGVNIMTNEQVGKWAGVREWLERDSKSYISPHSSENKS